MRPVTERPYGEGDHDRGDSVLEIAPRDELAAELPGVPLWVDS